MTIYTLRELVEHCLNMLKSSRWPASRCDKAADSFPGFAGIACIRLWHRHCHP